MESVNEFLVEVASVVWGPYMLIPLLLGTGVILTVRLRGVQFRKLWPALRLGLIIRKDPDATEGDISQYQALTTALAATVGVGNIAGVATAIYFGGPGALFWMWITGLVGMASKYSEAFLGVKYRVTDAKGEQSGGPQYYLARAIPNKFGLVLSLMFAVFAVLASFGIGNMTQANTVATQMDSTFGVPTWLSGIVMTVLAAAVLLGGIKSIGRVTAGFVPAMILLYVGAGIIVLAVNITDIPEAFALVFTDAFTGTAATGGFIGSVFMIALRYGVARGIFSNESGMGSAAIAAAAAQTTHPVRQGLVSMTQTFIDTIIVVTFTGMVIITTGAWTSGEQGAAMTSLAFSDGLGGDWGSWIVTISVVFFAFSTILGWSYYGDRCVERLVGRGGVLPYRAIFVLVVYVGATTELEVVWNFSDVMNGLMALPNLIGLLILSGLIARETKEYFARDPYLLGAKDSRTPTR
ncbi:sodium:alanine symporter family protein [Rhodococcus ruber]|uniref:Sodium/alanine symporter AgcS n=1 Tax=Rhodococcus ruber TaxID=1830 RepID=A0A098BU79_9NOCA|nr:sodium:alanine symporter family protein [Rhodococcus ruber]MCD2126784.1 sodium:alanine symporter family protein [Rhodococcus ruber]MCZ4503663.1 sodium:alanine symporter family protein [Rhodococcus ruber]MCZ4532223.1 sodium:alanine symporter family protein [Rhodococcus ruber]MCZ4619206.1 sodium:alanine symporter family protein [Rhodococcus ruber]MDI9968257.1 sodium:alanine symporter family protein [Rhodococcus ruber]